MKRVLITGLALLLTAGCSGTAPQQSAGGSAEAPQEEPVVYTLESAAAFMKEGNYPKAIETYSKLIESDPENYSLYIGRAEAYAMQKEYSSAVSDCTAAIGIDETNTEAYVFRGLLNYISGSAAEGEADIRKASVTAQGTDANVNLTAYRQLTDYAEKLAVTVTENTDTEGMTMTVLEMPDGTKALVIMLDGSPFGITTIPEGEEVPADPSVYALTMFEWDSEDGLIHTRFYDDGTVTMDLFGDAERIPYYISETDDVYPAGTVYIGGTSFHDDQTQYAAFFITYEESRYLLLSGVHFADEILLKAVIPQE
ncbi:MAG: tetratricopeptide repeat protein [Solobacterium sp.]|nr:tetratricopeptide repeat protein [Solobacterium sp.]